MAAVTMVIKTDLCCRRCRKKIKEVLCKIPQVQNQTYDEKANTVTITVISCDPETIKEKIYCKGGRAIKCIEIKKPEPKPDPKPQPKPDPKPQPKPDPTPKPPETKPIVCYPPPVLCYPPMVPCVPPIKVCCRKCSEGHGGRPCECCQEEPCRRPRPCCENCQRPMCSCRRCSDGCDGSCRRPSRFYGEYSMPIVCDNWGDGRLACRPVDYICQENPQVCIIM